MAATTLEEHALLAVLGDPGWTRRGSRPNLDLQGAGGGETQTWPGFDRSIWRSRTMVSSGGRLARRLGILRLVG
jgi:hypothetical protein